MAVKTTIKMKQDKVCKGSVRYKTDDPDAVLSNVYVSKTFKATMPKTVTVTIK